MSRAADSVLPKDDELLQPSEALKKASFAKTKKDSAHPVKTPKRRQKGASVKKPKVASPPVPKPPHVVTPEEMVADGIQLLHFVIPGRPATKKTHQRIVRRGGFTRILPSIEFEKYEALCRPYCEKAWRNLGNAPMNFGVSVELKVFLNNWIIGDETGYQQSLGDILEVCEVIADDKLIHWVSNNGHMISATPDKDNPRVEITICRFRHPYETFRSEREEAEERKKVRAAAKFAV